MTSKQQPSKTAQTLTGQPALNGPYTKGMRIVGVIFGLATIIISSLGIYFGFALAFFVVLGAYVLYIGIRTKTPYLSVMGVTGMAVTIISLLTL